MQSRRCCDRYAQDETANLTYMCSYGYTCPTHQISSLETKYSARISAGGQNPICKMRSKCGQRNRTSSPKTGHFRMHLRDTYAGTFSVGPRPGHANYPPVTRIDHISRLAAMGIWLHRACSVWRPGGTFTHGQPCQVKVNFQKARKRYLPLLASSRHITIPFWGKLIQGQKTYKAKNRPRAPVSSPCPG